MTFDMWNGESFYIHHLKNKFRCGLYKRQRQTKTRRKKFVKLLCMRWTKETKEREKRRRRSTTYFYGHQASQWHEQNSDEAPESISNEALSTLYTASQPHFFHKWSCLNLIFSSTSCFGSSKKKQKTCCPCPKMSSPKSPPLSSSYKLSPPGFFPNLLHPSSDLTKIHSNTSPWFWSSRRNDFSFLTLNPVGNCLI